MISSMGRAPMPAGMKGSISMKQQQTRRSFKNMVVVGLAALTLALGIGASVGLSDADAAKAKVDHRCVNTQTDRYLCKR